MGLRSAAGVLLAVVCLLFGCQQTSGARRALAQAPTATPTCAPVLLRTFTPLPAGTPTNTPTSVPWCGVFFDDPYRSYYGGSPGFTKETWPIWRADCNVDGITAITDLSACGNAPLYGVSAETPRPTATVTETPTPCGCGGGTATPTGSATATPTETGTPTITPTATEVKVTEAQADVLIDGLYTVAVLAGLGVAAAIASVFALAVLMFGGRR